MKKYLSLGAVFLLAVLAGTAVVLRGNGEDSWDCVNGEWQKHGNPSSSAPETGCAPGVRNVFANGQPYKYYQTDDVTFQYPDWPNIDSKMIPEPDKTPIAVSNDGCSFMAKREPLRDNLLFRTFMEKKIADAETSLSLKILSKDIGDNRANFTTEIRAGEKNIRGATFEFLTRANEVVGIAFAGTPEDFERVCAPILSEIVKNTVIK